MIEPAHYIKVIDGRKKMPVYAYADMINEFVDKDGMIDLDLTVKETKKAMKGIWRKTSKEEAE